jgi:hypothetical protein
MITETWTSQWLERYGGAKAKRDVLEILRRKVSTLRCHASSPALPTLGEVANPSVAVLQFPTRGMSPPRVDPCDIERFAEEWKERWPFRIVIVHDLKSVQSNLFGERDDARTHDWVTCERALLVSATEVVTHTARMEHWIKEQYSCTSARFLRLPLFDYLCDPQPVTRPSRVPGIITVAFAGNLHASPLADEFAQHLPSHPRLRYEFYGSPVRSPLWSRPDVTWLGDVEPEELPARLAASDADFGLCWWSSAILSSKYLQMIAPHKASCYLAAGLPLLVPADSHVASLAAAYRIGVSLGTLGDILDTVERALVERIDFDKLHSVSRDVRAGCFLGAVLDLALPYAART